MTLPKHLLTVESLEIEDVKLILDTASELEKVSQASMRKLPTLRGRTIVNLFFENSTRTRISFEAAAKRLSADVINFAAQGSSLSKGESLKDTALTLQAMGADAIVIRHGSSGAPHRLAHSGWVLGPIINAGDGTHQHPTQALLDAYTLREHFAERGRDLNTLKIGVIGDVLHSRVARSNIFLLSKLGAEVTLISSPTLLPVGVEKWPVKVSYDLDLSLKDLDVVMALRIQKERMDQFFFPSEREYARHYGLNFKRLSSLKPEAVILHPGPMNRGLEIDALSADSSRSLIVKQVTNGIYLRMAVLYLFLASENSLPGTQGDDSDLKDSPSSEEISRDRRVNQ
jgi:aspartate carbamoyltransferase catalytic subunit